MQLRGRRALLALVILAGLLVHASCLSWGFYADDYAHQLVLHGAEHPSLKPWNLYDFGAFPQPGSADWERGSFPWWTAPDWKVRFLRPLASCSLWLDHALFGDRALGYHATGLVLFALLLWASHGLYRAWGLAPGAALLATLFVAVEDGGTIPVGWIANRNSLVEALFVVLAVLVVARAKRASAATVMLAFALALGAALSKESGVVAFPLVALSLFARTDETPARLKLAAAGASVACALGYVALLVGAEYGAHSAFYPTPWGEPAAFVRGLVLLLGTAPPAMASPFPPDVFWIAPELAQAAVWGSLVLIPVYFTGAASVALRLPRATPFLLWTLATLAPQGGAPLSDRLLLVPMIGFAPLLALAVTRGRAAGGWRRVGAWVLFALAGPLSALSCFGRGVQFTEISARLRAVVLEAEVGAPELGQRDVFVLNSPSAVATLMPLPTWVRETGDEGVRFWLLQLGKRELTWTRTGASTFELRSEGAAFLTGPVEAVFLGEPPRSLAGRSWETSLFRVEALEAEPQGLRSVRFTLSSDLDRPGVRFLAWDGERLARVATPAVGESVRVPAAEPLQPFFP